MSGHMRADARKKRGAKVDQTILASDPNRVGNCFAACVATAFGIPLDRVPHFVEWGIHYGDGSTEGAPSKGNHWWAMFIGFAAGRGYTVHEVDSLDDVRAGEPALVAGMSPRGVLHQVIYRDGVLWHDPHPSRDGVLDVREVMVLRPDARFDHTPTEEPS